MCSSTAPTPRPAPTKQWEHSRLLIYGLKTTRAQVYDRCARAELRSETCAYFTGDGESFQMSLAYSRMVRSLENLPTRAVLRIAIRAQRFVSR